MDQDKYDQFKTDCFDRVSRAPNHMKYSIALIEFNKLRELVMEGLSPEQQISLMDTCIEMNTNIGLYSYLPKEVEKVDKNIDAFLAIKKAVGDWRIKNGTITSAIKKHGVVGNPTECVAFIIDPDSLEIRIESFLNQNDTPLITLVRVNKLDPDSVVEGYDLTATFGSVDQMYEKLVAAGMDEDDLTNISYGATDDSRITLEYDEFFSYRNWVDAFTVYNWDELTEVMVDQYLEGKADNWEKQIKEQLKVNPKGMSENEMRKALYGLMKNKK